MSWTRPRNRRALSELDAGAPASDTRPIHRTRREPTVTATTEAPARPPRPAHIDPVVLAEAARRLGAKRCEIVSVLDTDAGRIIETSDGTAVIDVPPDHPDGAGQTGLLVYRGVTGKDTSLPRYVDPRLQQSAGEAWTVADLDVEAARLHVPAPTYDGPSGPSRRGWVGADPIRARAVWVKIAAGLDVEPGQAVHRSAEAAHCRQVIAACGWLSDREAAAL